MPNLGFGVQKKNKWDPKKLHGVHRSKDEAYELSMKGFWIFYLFKNRIKKIALCRNMNVCFNACHAELTEKDQNIMKEVIMS